MAQGNMTQSTASQIVLASRPLGRPQPDNFRLEEVAMPTTPPRGLLLSVLYLSLEPYMPGRLDDRTFYAKPVGIGEVICPARASPR
jgi:NADPH-dependent curcumin reductase